MIPAENARRIVEKLERQRLNIPEAVYEDFLVPFEKTEICQREYEVLKEITALYSSTPEKEHGSGNIKLENGNVVYFNAINKGLAYVPDSLGELGELERLYLGGNRLTSVPDSLGKLGELERLGLGGNQLRSVPDSLGDLGELKVLYLANNKLDPMEKEKLKKMFGKKVIL